MLSTVVSSASRQLIVADCQSANNSTSRRQLSCWRQEKEDADGKEYRDWRVFFSRQTGYYKRDDFRREGDRVRVKERKRNETTIRSNNDRLVICSPIAGRVKDER